MILDEKVRAGSVLVCRKARFGAHTEDADATTFAVVLTPAERQSNRTVDAVPLADVVPLNRDVLSVRLRHDALAALSTTGQWFALCDRMTRLSLDCGDVEYLRRERGSAVNFEPRFHVTGDDLKSIRLSMVLQLFPASDLRSYFGRGMRSFRALAARLVLHRADRRTVH